MSKNGNQLLDVGPEADGTIPTVQMKRLQALGACRKQDGAAIYGTHPYLLDEYYKDSDLAEKLKEAKKR